MRKNYLELKILRRLSLKKEGEQLQKKGESLNKRGK